MIDFLISVHSETSEKMLRAVFLRIPHMRIITFGFQHAFQQPPEQVKALQEFVRANNINPSSIRYICVESNYGKPNEDWLNELLFNYLLANFSNAKIIAYSSTTGSLAKALAHNNAISILGKGQEVLDELKAPYGQELPSELSERIFSTAQLREYLTQHQQSPPKRTRALSDLDISVEATLFRTRSPSLPLVPQFNAALERNSPTPSPDRMDEGGAEKPAPSRQFPC